MSGVDFEEAGHKLLKIKLEMELCVMLLECCSQERTTRIHYSLGTADTTSSSRIFIKTLFQELSEHLGIRLLNERLTDPAMQDSFKSIFPRDNPKNTRFAINFFTSIGLAGITENLREYLKRMPRLIMQQQNAASDQESDSSGSLDSDSNSGSACSESESESESESSSSERRKKKRRRRN
ncbi:pre-mRNA-splicing factor CWC22 homolog [Rosa chinensis]|uniref:pre-mRNA-splicing factor CWC22 homolog n=1 Tax=Rosa chinensis TaxID=74649 RepID=UPI001AD8C99B|nr:pre-mRNA-splicing factor CWC22 homolog [Rosa chinensis]